MFGESLFGHFAVLPAQMAWFSTMWRFLRALLFICLRRRGKVKATGGGGGVLALMVNEKQQVINWCLNSFKHADGDYIHAGVG